VTGAPSPAGDGGHVDTARPRRFRRRALARALTTAQRPLRAVAAITVLGAVAGAVTAGASGLVGALVAGAMLALLFGGSASTAALASGAGGSRLAAVTFGGLVVRFLAYTGVLWAVAATGVADLLVVAAVTAAGLVTVLAVELRAALGHSARPADASGATRS